MTYAHPSDGRAAPGPATSSIGSGYRDLGLPLLSVEGRQQRHHRLLQADGRPGRRRAHPAHRRVDGLRQRPPQVVVNSWTSAIPAAPSNAGTRSLTVGAYRSFTSTLTYPIPASAFQTDTTQWNILKLSVVSGSTGDTYLSPGLAFDCLDLLT